MLMSEEQQQNISTHTAFVEAFSKELAKQFFRPMDAQEIQDLEKVSKIWIKNLDSIGNKMNNTKLLMIDMNPKDAIKIDTSKLQSFTKYLRQTLVFM